ncbi:hypothetical protein MLD38_009703 [Melastoma candidum]|uniref:Uncharacterized protein n=1 Tax=Melastoma candidum TaxID=119954 RepID=A0ACB9RYK8_9MYRT|nr:hypothetical protein MLD38_009703 [Melastoma candidum]
MRGRSYRALLTLPGSRLEPCSSHADGPSNDMAWVPCLACIGCSSPVVFDHLSPPPALLLVAEQHSASRPRVAPAVAARAFST